MSLRKLLLFLPALLLAACNLPRGGDGTATPSLNPTQSYQTAIARVTDLFEQTQAAQNGEPSATPEPILPTDTPAPGTPSATPETPTAAPTNTPEPCDKAAPGNPIDVTIPDDTEMLPGQAFTKTWRLVNSGTCTWTNQYAVVWVSGAQIGDQDVVFLSGTVGPGQSVDISVPMTAPTEPGSYQSNWMLRNAAGVHFGIGDDADSFFWVRIKVVPPTATPTPTSTATPTPTETPTEPSTATPTPVVHASGTLLLVPGDALDLDAVQANAGGDDLTYAMDGGGNHVITPLSGTSIGVFGTAQPGLAECQAASLGSAPLAVESVGVGWYLCYQTAEGRYGWLHLDALDTDTLTVTALTWALP